MSEEAGNAFVEQVRFPFHRAGVGDILAEGRRGSGGQRPSSEVWGVSTDDYFQKADVWPLNPAGEILLGIKIENKRGLANAEANTRVPGVAFVEWAPLDMSLSLGALGGNLPPYPPVMEASRQRVVAAAKAANIAYCGQVRPHNIVQYLAEGMMVGVPLDPETAEIGRKQTGRTMPW